MSELVTHADGKERCFWAGPGDDYIEYHDVEWGFGVTDDQRLFEKICLEGFQAGLSWLMVLRKRDRFREVFDGFDPAVVARFGDADIERLVSDAGIIRHRGKIRSTINNAQRALEIIDEHGSLAAFFWPYADLTDTPPVEAVATTEVSTELSKRLKKLGWSFVGPTTIYAFMQAMGLVNDHFDGCHVRAAAQSARLNAAKAVP